MWFSSLGLMVTVLQTGRIQYVPKTADFSPSQVFTRDDLVQLEAGAHQSVTWPRRPDKRVHEAVKMDGMLSPKQLRRIT